MRLEDLNALDSSAAVRALLRCCGSARWAEQMAAARPFSSVEQMTATADAIWSSLDRGDWLEAFAAHPRIGDQRRSGGTERAPAPAEERLRPYRAEDREIRGEVSASVRGGGGALPPVQGRWSDQEQAGARSASDGERERLSAGNQAYEAHFGFIFIVCASGKSAGEMLAMLERRLRHDPAQELHVAAEEQRKITRLRLIRLLDGE